LLKADLHIHTTASDGKLSPAQVVAHALTTDLDVIAITDHDTIDGVAEAKLASEGTPLQVVNAAEVSTIYQNRECHLLAYSFEDAGVMTGLFRGQKDKRIERAQSIIHNLNKLGFDISYDEVLGEAGNASIGRPHIARVMIKKGFAADIQEVFFRYLGNSSSAYHQIDYPDISEAIDLVHQAGGYAILAHPADNYTFIDIKKFREYGLDGIECFHSSHNSWHQRRFTDYCENFDLLITGGSDFHGSVQDFHHFGTIHTKLEPDSPLLKTRAAEPQKNSKTYSETLCK